MATDNKLEVTRPETDAVVLQARDTLQRNQIPCTISQSGKALYVHAETYRRAKQLLAGLNVPVYLSQKSGPSRQAAKVESVKPVEATPGAAALIQLLNQANPKMKAQLSPTDGNAVFVDSGFYRDAAKVRASRPDLASVKILMKVT